jgi:hypothetical protein
MITKIELVETLQTMGEATEEDLFRWCAQLRSRLLNEYPGTEIYVQAVADLTSNQIHVEVDDDTDTLSAKATVQKIVRQCWKLWS